MNKGPIALAPYLGEPVPDWLRRIAGSLESNPGFKAILLVYDVVENGQGEQVRFHTTPNITKPSEFFGIVEMAKHSYLDAWS